MFKLKNCPCCGKQAASKTVQQPFSHGWIGCTKCQLYIQWKYDPSKAIERWNNRIAEHPESLAANAGAPGRTA